ncbi:hypothetical protein SAMN04487904_101559 [Actinopolyspora lacussalsi subsp. righensis]|uniref:Uncharacterized protein n=1 Tax=Actinopolyspora righensis TaxID=995060 RepID=A0A1I6XFS9_9ACTN|nr:hypothetical protein SAMN04487904_101559 [Actinopolyspora righensis]
MPPGKTSAANSHRRPPAEPPAGPAPDSAPASDAAPRWRSWPSRCTAGRTASVCASHWKTPPARSPPPSRANPAPTWCTKPCPPRAHCCARRPNRTWSNSPRWPAPAASRPGRCWCSTPPARCPGPRGCAIPRSPAAPSSPSPADGPKPSSTPSPWDWKTSVATTRSSVNAPKPWCRAISSPPPTTAAAWGTWSPGPSPNRPTRNRSNCCATTDSPNWPTTYEPRSAWSPKPLMRCG